jgi:hypothetical protein
VGGLKLIFTGFIGDDPRPSALLALYLCDFAANTDVKILSEAPSPASASLEKPDKKKSACSRGITASA